MKNIQKMAVVMMMMSLVAHAKLTKLQTQQLNEQAGAVKAYVGRITWNQAVVDSFIEKFQEGKSWDSSTKNTEGAEILGQLHERMDAGKQLQNNLSKLLNTTDKEFKKAIDALKIKVATTIAQFNVMKNKIIASYPENKAPSPIVKKKTGYQPFIPR